jgi:DNA polymerase III subunit chi
VGGTERAEALDQSLWTYRDDSFLPHGLAGDDADAMQPVLVTTRADNPNGANIRFFVDGAVPRETGTYDRLVYVFNGHDPEAVQTARDVWKALREGNDVSYWQQDPNGRWVKKG